MADDNIIITGLTETQRMLVEMPGDLGRSGLARALAAGAVVLQEDLRTNAPVGQGGHSEFAPLRDSLVTDLHVDANGLTGVAETGFGDSGPVALWNEYGHRIVTRSGRDTGRSTQQNPFMRRTTDSSAAAAIDAFCDSLLNTVRDQYGS